MIRAGDYVERVRSVQLQYDFVRSAVVGHLCAHFGSKLSNAEVGHYISLCFYFARDYSAQCDPCEQPDLTDINWKLTLETILDSIKDDFPGRPKELENRLAQNEVILLVVLMEDEIKSIHREFLKQAPQFLDPDRPLKLGRLIAVKQEEIIAEEIERAVQLMDRKNVAERAKEFERLGLRWDIAHNEVNEVIQLRNMILHEDMDKRVSANELQRTRDITRKLPTGMIGQAAKLYPQVFQAEMRSIEKTL